ncbi:MAG: cyanophycinase [Acidiferrobacteraceae bacterium]|jgi:cyanophycinase|nr:cyanophycinase [Acidiferrobacteraceae bacterium]MBT3640121.1 cyanophycinase [Acidiferrobacteraceae bacterium]MBT3770194.1 cyanophycinase [Acidiferrobacteraceae bacterium]MBT3973175.1 cyanophycinase [Acidiferrobacteraceae bacterium]MBT4396362.1 cyanophycinase [Acidiferrobacteraceae bacterium]
MCPSKTTDGSARGYIIPIGGAEEKLDNPEILDRFVEICGGKDARISIIPTASELEDTGRNYEKLFRTLGIKHTRVLQMMTREDCQSSEFLDYIENSDGVFMTGGNQLRLSTTLGGTPVAQMIRRRNAAGMHVAGTSAGAAFIPEHMIAGGVEGSTPTPDMVTMAPGLGLTNNFIIDQHFRQRDRLGRLLTALAYNPFAVGIGLDEDTAAFIRPGDDLEVVGSGGITIIDPSELSHSSMDSARRGEPVSLINVKLHTLISGGRFTIRSREASFE